MLTFLGWPSLRLGQQKRLLFFAARVLGSPVPLIRNTALSVLQHHQQLPWSSHVRRPITEWKLDRELAKAFSASKAAGHLSRTIRRLWPKLCPPAHLSVALSPLSASYTFRFYRGSLDTKDKPPRTCPLCNDASESAAHLASCPAPGPSALWSPLLPEERQWLASPRTAIPQLRVSQLSSIHRRLWDLRREALAEYPTG